MSIFLYDDFELGNLDKWSYWESLADDYAIVVDGDANIPTKHLEQKSTYQNSNTLISNGDVGEGKYIKCGIFRWANIQAGASALIIRAVGSGSLDNSFYVAVLDLSFGTRIFKGVDGSFTLLKQEVNSKWSEHTNYIAEFYQESNGNLVVKKDGVIQAQVINTEVTGDKIGFRCGNACFGWADNVYADIEVSLFSRGRMINSGGTLGGLTKSTLNNLGGI